MEEIILNAQLRQNLGKSKVKGLRVKGIIPAVIYGADKQPQPLCVLEKEFIELMHRYRLENTVINLKIKNDEDQKSKVCLVKEIQHDPVHGNVIHLDFNEVSLTKTIKVNVPIAVKGEAVGVKQEGGSLERILWDVEIECLPAKIPQEIEVDVTNLKIGDSIHITDINFASGIKVLNEPNAVVLHIIAPMKEEVPLEAVEGEEKKEPEVIKEKKEEAKPQEETKEKK